MAIVKKRFFLEHGKAAWGNSLFSNLKWEPAFTKAEFGSKPRRVRSSQTFLL